TGVLHVEADLVVGRLGGDVGEVDLLHRRPGCRHHDLRLQGVAHGVDRRRPLGQVAVLHPAGQALPGGAVSNTGDGDHVVGGPAPVGVVAVPEQAGVGVAGEGGHPLVAVGGLEVILRSSAAVVGL